MPSQLERNAAIIAGIAAEYQATDDPIGLINELIGLSITVQKIYSHLAESMAVRIKIFPRHIGSFYEEHDPYKARNGRWVFVIIREKRIAGLALRRDHQDCSAGAFSVEVVFYHV